MQQETLYSGGIYFVQNDDVTDKMEVINQLQSIPYSIVKLSRPYYSSSVMYENRKINLDFGTIQPASLSSDFTNEIDVSQVWGNGYNGTDVVIAIVDIGVDFSHPALTGKMVAEKSFHKIEYGFESDLGPDPTGDHGTAVAAAAAGYDDGIYKAPAFAAKLVNARVGLEDGFSTTASVVAAMDWAIGLDSVDIVSMSLSEPEEGFSFDPLEEMVNQGVQNGKVIVTSAGNSGGSADTYTVGSPSSSPEVISVGATNSLGDLASFSSEGPSYGNEAKPDIIAPGVINIAVLGGGYSSGGGTSYSTPIVSGGLATLIQYARNQGLTLSPGQFKSFLLHGANDVGYNAYEQGFGFLNVSKSYELIESDQYSPVIGPDELHIDSIELPVNTDILVPLTLIGFPSNSINIQSNSSDIDLKWSWRYQGESSILHLNLKLTDYTNLKAVRLDISYFDTENIFYTIPVTPMIQPDFQVLLDLRHTIFDTIQDSGNDGIIERKNGRDISPLVDTIEAQNGWVIEFWGDALYSNNLTGFDVVWMPSAFTVSSPIPYDHPYLETPLSVDELFVLHDYMTSGGSIILDIGGSSIFDSDYEFTNHDLSLIMMEYLFGMRIDQLNEWTFTQSTIESLLVSNEVAVPSGQYSLTYGIPFVEGDLGSSAMGKYVGSGSIYVHNSRNWRDATRGNDPQAVAYMGDVVEFISGNPQVTGYHISQDQISVDTTIDVSPVDVTLSSNNEQLDFSISRQEKSLILSGDFSAGSDIQLELKQSDTTVLNISDRVPGNPATLVNSSSEIDGNTLTIETYFSGSNFIPATTQLLYQDQPVTAQIQQNGNFFTITYVFSGSIEQDLDQFKMRIIDTYGQQAIYNLAEPTGIDPTATSDDGSDGFLVIGGFLTLFGILILGLVNRKKFKNME